MIIIYRWSGRCQKHLFKLLIQSIKIFGQNRLPSKLPLFVFIHKKYENKKESSFYDNIALHLIASPLTFNLFKKKITSCYIFFSNKLSRQHECKIEQKKKTRANQHQLIVRRNMRRQFSQFFFFARSFI